MDDFETTTFTHGGKTRTVFRIGDGPDQVHMSQLGRTLLKQYA